MARECLAAQVATALDEVRVATQRLAQQLSAAAEDDAQRRQLMQQLTRSDEAFDHHRQAACDLEAASAFGGNGAHDLRLRCELKLLQQRRSHLLELTEAFNAR